MFLFAASLLVGTQSKVADSATLPDIKTYIQQTLGTKMVKVLTCESNLSQYDSDGDVLISKTHDKGISQINIPTWGKKANSMGLDLNDPYQNVDMAKYILDTAGIKSWTCSRILAIK